MTDILDAILDYENLQDIQDMSEGKVIVEPVYDGHFGRHLEFPRTLKALYLVILHIFLDLPCKNQLVTRDVEVLANTIGEVVQTRIKYYVG